MTGIRRGCPFLSPLLLLLVLPAAGAGLSKVYPGKMSGSRTGLVPVCGAEDVGRIENLHIWVKAGEEDLPGYTRPRPLNASWDAIEKILGPTRQDGTTSSVRRSSDPLLSAAPGATRSRSWSSRAGRR